MREAIRERRALLRIAPHLVHPLPFLIPTYKRLLQRKLILSLALKLNDMISVDRNRNLDIGNKIPRGRVISKARCAKLCPGLDQQDVTGGAIFFDGQVANPDRLNMALLISAVQAGARAVNYVEATGFLQQRNQVTGLRIRDVLSGESWTLRARLIVNCAGPWADRVLEGLRGTGKPTLAGLCKSFVLVTRPLVSGIAVGVPGQFEYTDRDAVVKKGFRYFFIIPWRNTSLVGTFQIPYDGKPDALKVSEQEIGDAIRAINLAYPAAGLQRHDVISVLRGIVPGSEDFDGDGHVQLKKHHEIRDHAAEDGIEGLLSVIGVKYTTARGVAERTVDRVFEKLGVKSPKCETAETPVHGGAIGSFKEFLARAIEKRPSRLSVESAQHLALTYGSACEDILRYCDSEPCGSEQIVCDSPVIKAEILHSVRAEMALKLSDVIFRRTDLGTAGYPGDDALTRCAEIMGSELGWNRQRIGKELQEVQAEF
jgi:glycerol-3-phosphate dehydrogenase